MTTGPTASRCWSPSQGGGLLCGRRSGRKGWRERASLPQQSGAWSTANLPPRGARNERSFIMTIPTLIGPALTALLMLGGWMTAQTRDQNGLPRRGLVTLGQALASLGLVVGVLAVPLTLPTVTYAASLGVVLVVGLVLVRGAGRLAIGWTSTAEMMTSAVGLGWRRPARVLWSLLALCGGLTLAVWLAGQDEPAAGLLGALVALAPARWWLPWGAQRERARTGIERAVAGTWRGAEWSAAEAEQRGAPVRVRFKGDATPVSLTAALPPAWRASAVESDRAELRERLSAWGSPWAVEMDPSSRRLRARLCEPLPSRWVIPSDRSWDWIDKHKPSTLSLYLGEAQDADTGSAFPLWWDPDATDPHALVGGKTKSGKTVGLRLLAAQAIARGWDVVIADPKGVDFAWAARLPGVRYFPGANCLDGVAEAVGEMRERQRWLQRNLWSGAAGADEEGDLLKVPGQPYRPCLVIVDEAAELMGLGDKDDRATSAESLSSLARLSRFVGIVCCFATQRPDVKFLSGETKANLGTRVLYGSGGPTLTNMVLDIASRDLAKLTATARGRGRAVIEEGVALEFQGGFITPATVKRLRGVLAPDALPPIRFVKEPEWRKLLRKGSDVEQMNPDALKHPDFDRVAAELDAEIEKSDAASEEGAVPDSSSQPDKSGHDNLTDFEDSTEPESSSKPVQDRDKGQEDSEHGPQSDLSIDPLDFWEDD